MFWQFQPSGTVCFMFLGRWCSIFARFFVKTNSVLKTEMVGTILSKKNKVVDNSFIHFKNQAIIQWTISPKAVSIHLTTSEKYLYYLPWISGWLMKILIMVYCNPCNGGALCSQNHGTSKTDLAILNLINVAVHLLPYFWPPWSIASSTNQLSNTQGCKIYWSGGGFRKCSLSVDPSFNLTMKKTCSPSIWPPSLIKWFLAILRGRYWISSIDLSFDGIKLHC